MSAPAGARIAVVGASLAGLSAVQALLESPAVAEVTVFGAEERLPYDRPPLSKEILRGEWSPERCNLEVPEDSRLRWRTGTPVTGLEVAGRRLRFGDGEVEAFPGGIVIATGANPRRIPGDSLPGVHVLRTVDDATSLASDFDRGPRSVVIVGAGFIGAEVAAAALDRGLSVTVLESLNHPFERVLGAEVGEAVMAPLRTRGVVLHTGVAVAALHGADRIEQVELSDGSHVEADVVVLALGVEPATAWLAGSGLSVDNGVLCDATLSAAPGIVAAGDVARWPNTRFGEFRRVEHWDNAIRQGRHAALRLLAELEPPTEGSSAAAEFATVPWVWSDQSSHKLQIVGSTFEFDEVLIAHGALADERFVALYRRGEHLVAAAGFNQPKLITRYRRTLAAPALWNDVLARLESSPGAGAGSTVPAAERA